MAKRRMAGESLAARNRAARERKSNDPAELASRVAKAQGAGYDLSGYSDKEISMALQGDSFGAEDYYRLTGKKADSGSGSSSSSAAADEAQAANTAAADNIVNDYINKNEDQSIGLPGGPSFGGGMSQNVNQDNDITTSITGDGNTVTNDQNNSVSQGGGDYAAEYARGLKNQYVLNLLGKE